MFTDETGATYAGAVAASGLAVAKQLPLRNPPPVGLSSRFRPATLGDLPRLFSKSENPKPHENIARVSSAGIVYSVDKDRTTSSQKLLNGDEAKTLTSLWKERQTKRNQKKVDRTCPYCRLLHSTVYGSKTLPKVVVANHMARINVDFDPDTNISKATIENFQVLVPQRVATELIKCARPLHWADMQGTLFRSIRAVDRNGEASKLTESLWEHQAASEAFIFENCAIPLNDDLVASVENVLSISQFTHSVSSAGIELLNYDYSLENCVGSHFGVAFEPSGLDIDGGTCRIESIPVAHPWGAVSFAIDQTPLKELMVRDIAEMDALVGDPAVPLDTAESDRATLDDTRKKIIGLAQRLAVQEQEPYFLVTISASKQLHFTVPENGPAELWQLLTWTAPAFLFTFMNLSVCLAPHMLLDVVPPPKSISPLDPKVYQAASASNVSVLLSSDALPMD